MLQHTHLKDFYFISLNKVQIWLFSWKIWETLVELEKADAIYDNLNIIVDQIVPKLEEYKRNFQCQK